MPSITHRLTQSLGAPRDRPGRSPPSDAVGRPLPRLPQRRAHSPALQGGQHPRHVTRRDEGRPGSAIRALPWPRAQRMPQERPPPPSPHRPQQGQARLGRRGCVADVLPLPAPSQRLQWLLAGAPRQPQQGRRPRWLAAHWRPGGSREHYAGQTLSHPRPPNLEPVALLALPGPGPGVGDQIRRTPRGMPETP